jgi:multidrug efflux pump subunit AcrA (membrane-fusion protein)
MMRETVQQTQGVPDALVERPRSRRRTITATVVITVILAGAGAAAGAWRAGVFKNSSTPAGNSAAAPPATATVQQGAVSATTPVNGTLGYADSYTIRGQGSNGGATLTWLPAAGTIIRQGHVLYRTGNGTPIILMYGRVPDWRAMSEGTTGADVTQLNHDLVGLGYASAADIEALGWDYYSWDTNYAVELLEEHYGVSSPSGSLALGDIVFEPQAIRVAGVSAIIGESGSGSIMTATSDKHQIVVALSTSEQSQVKTGDPVTVTMPGGSTADGVISSVGTVASGTGSNATVNVYVQLKDPKAAGTLDQAPVTVNITNSHASNVTIVPVTALLAQPGGGYAVEAVGAGNTRRLVKVTTGVFDDSSGMVQVTGNLTPGQKVVVPAS